MKRRMFSRLAVAVLLAAMGLQAQAASKAKGELSGVVNINEANVAQLMMLPGVGQKRGEAIREYVTAHPFKSLEELKAIKGIGDKGFEKLKSYVTLSGPTTAKWVKSNSAQLTPVTQQPAN